MFSDKNIDIEQKCGNQKRAFLYFGVQHIQLYKTSYIVCYNI